MKKLLIVAVVALLALALVACGGSEKPAATTATTTLAGTVGETTPTTVTTTPAGTVGETTPTTPAGTTAPTEPSKTPNADWIDNVLFEEGQWIQPHMEYRISSGVGENGVEYDYIWYFTIKAEGGHFHNTVEDHPNKPNTPGIQLTTPVALYIKDFYSDEDYVRYEISYYTTAQWYEIWCVADGFVPVDGTEYDIYLVIQTPDDIYDESGEVLYTNGATYPNTLHYIWTLGEPWVYNAPEKSESKYFNQDQLDEIVGDAWWLLENDPTTVDADGNIVVKFKSDGNPFDNSTDTKGVAFTLMNELYINGEKYEVESYVPEQWYILNIKVKDFTPVAGETYEIIITINSNDTTGTYCKYDSYYVLAKEVTFAG